jgi:hypothetical protein
MALLVLHLGAHAQQNTTESGCMLSSRLAFQLAEDRDAGVTREHATANVSAIPYVPLPGPYATPIVPSEQVLSLVYSFSYRSLSPNALAVLVLLQCIPSPDQHDAIIPKLVADCQNRYDAFGEISWCVNRVLWRLPENMPPMPQIVRQRITRITAR